MDQSLDMKAIEDQLGIRGIFTDAFGKSRGQIESDVLDLLRPFGPELAEKSRDGLRTLAFASPNDSAGRMVCDDRDVLVMLAITQLVDTNVRESVEPLGAQQSG